MLLRREGWQVNAKRIHRLYGEEQLQLRTAKRKKKTPHVRVLLPPAGNPTNAGAWTS